MRDRSASDFFVDVDGIGRFGFGRRTMRDTFKIRGEYNRLTDGNYDAEGNVADFTAYALSAIKVLMVSGPDGFDIDKLDPIVDDDWDKKIVDIFAAVRKTELSFRPQSAGDVQTQGEVAKAKLPDGVQTQVQPSA